MPFQPVLSSPNFSALGLGALAYFVLGALVGWLLPHLSHPLGAAVLSIFFICPGILVGILAKRSPLMHGVLLGILIVLFLALLIAIAGALGVRGSSRALFQLGSMAVVSTVALIIASSLGAVLGDFIGDKLRGL